MMGMNFFKTSTLWYVLALPALAQLFVACLFHGADQIPPAALALGTATITIVIACMLWPMLFSDTLVQPRDLGLWTLLTSAVALLLMMANTPVASWPSLALPLAAGVLAISFLLGTLTLFLNRLVKLDAPIAHRVVLTTFIVAATTPLWLGPVAGMLASQGFTDLIIAVSPVGYLISLIDYDALRSAWFYTHTPLGGLRYDYPNPVIFTMIYCSWAALMLGISCVRWHRFAGKDDTNFTSFHFIHKEPTI